MVNTVLLQSRSKTETAPGAAGAANTVPGAVLQYAYQHRHYTPRAVVSGGRRPRIFPGDEGKLRLLFEAANFRDVARRQNRAAQVARLVINSTDPLGCARSTWALLPTSQQAARGRGISLPRRACGFLALLFRRDGHNSARFRPLFPTLQARSGGIMAFTRLDLVCEQGPP